MNQKVLIYSPYALSTSHHEFSLEMARSHIQRGDETHVLICNGQLTTCDQNVSHRYLTCLKCTSVAKQSFLNVGVKKPNIHLLKLNRVINPSSIPTFQTFKSLCNYTWNGLRAGYSVSNSILSQCRDTDPDMEKWGGYASETLGLTLSVYEFFKDFLHKHAFKLLYIFNGRTFAYNAALEAAKSLGISCLVGERESQGMYVTYENTHCMDLPDQRKSLLEFEKKMQKDPKGKEIAENWFEISRKGCGDFNHNYIKQQTMGYLPKNFNSSKKNIAIFISSEDETINEPHFKIPLFSSQNEAIKFIINNLADKNTHIFARVHPNLKGIYCSQVRNFSVLSAENFTLIPADSPVHSYSLLDAADTVVTFGSTISIEGVYWNKPVILLGRNHFEELDTFYIPKNPEELLYLLKSDLKAFPRQKALAYGYWRAKRGHKFQEIEFQDPIKGNLPCFKGKPLFVPGKFVSYFFLWYYRLVKLCGMLPNSLKRHS